MKTRSGLHHLARMLWLVVLLVGVALTGCQTSLFHQEFEEGFAYGPLMRVAAYPEYYIPQLDWADVASETIQNDQLGGGGDNSPVDTGGGDDCPT